jgi:hypothetical protein
MNTNASLTGQSGALVTGSVGASVIDYVSLAGQQGAFSTGSIAAKGVMIDLNGTSSSFYSGNTFTEVQHAISGESVSTNTGYFASQEITVGLTGSSTSFSVGILNEQKIRLTGSQANTSTGTLYQSISAFQDYCWEGYFVTGYVTGLSECPACVGLTAEQDAWLESIALLHGVGDHPVVTTNTSRVAGTLVQAINQTSTSVTINTTTKLTGTSSTGITSRQLQLLESLARIHGLVNPVTTTQNMRTDGVIAQTLDSNNTTLTIIKI